MGSWHCEPDGTWVNLDARERARIAAERERRVGGSIRRALVGIEARSERHRRATLRVRAENEAMLAEKVGKADERRVQRRSERAGVDTIRSELLNDV